MQLRERFDDRLEFLGTAAGVFLVLAGLGTLLGQPWQTKPDLLVVLFQLLGIVGTVAIGAGLIYLSRTTDE